MLWLYNQGGEIPFLGHIDKRSGRNMVPHDIYLGRAADEGLISIVMLAAMMALAGREFIRKWNADPKGRLFNRDSLAAMAAIMACYMVGGLTIDYRYFDLINVMIYLFMGIVYGYPIAVASHTGNGAMPGPRPSVPTPGITPGYQTSRSGHDLF
jgi:hypothetical protein